MQNGHVQVSREEKGDARPSVMGERKTSTESRVSFDPRDSELIWASGGQGLAYGLSLVNGHNIRPFATSEKAEF